MRWMAVLLGCVAALCAHGVGAEPRIGPPTMQLDRLSATDAAGHRLGTLIWSSILAPASPGRKLLVVFNGGPGAASGWLQLGLLGPWQIDDAGPLEATDMPALAPGRVGLWSNSDVLFVDPLGTGFSRARADAPVWIHDRDGDAAYLARAIRVWVHRHGRDREPVVLLGESYGAERAVAVARAWDRVHAPVQLAGLVLVSQTVIDAASLDRSSGPAMLPANLPTMASTDCAQRGDADPLACAERAQRLLDDVSRMHAVVGNADLAAMVGGHRAMSLSRFRRIAAGLPARVLWLYDTRQAAAHTAPGNDPDLAALVARMTMAARKASQLALGRDRSPVDGTPYVLYDPRIRAAWRYRAGADPQARALADLSCVLRHSTARVLIAGGVFDAVGSYAADRRLARALPAGRVTVRTFRGGHMFYLDPDCRRALLATLQGFLDGTAGARDRPGHWT